MLTADRVTARRSRGVAPLVIVAAVYLLACGVMTAPICNLTHLGSASNGGDSRLIIWTLAWDNQALLDRVPSLFDANIFYPAKDALAYSEHLYGISLFTLPVYALTRNPVLAYNLVWLLSFLLSAAAAHALAWRAIAILAAAGCGTLHARFGRLGRALTCVAIPLFLIESYVVNFPGGGQPVFLIPPVYRFIASRSPGPVVSLPDYAGTPVAFEEANYQFFSTTHWHPIANGYSRAEPPGFRALMDRLNTFPAPASLDAMGEAGIRYVVLHSAAAPSPAAQASSSDRVRLLVRFENDYLFEVPPR
jgi:hypothetical protein